MGKIKLLVLLGLQFCISSIYSQVRTSTVFQQFQNLYKQKNVVGLNNLLSDSIVIVDENNGNITPKKDYIAYLENWSMVMGTK